MNNDDFVNSCVNRVMVSVEWSISWFTEQLFGWSSLVWRLIFVAGVYIDIVGNECRDFSVAAVDMK